MNENHDKGNNDFKQAHKDATKFINFLDLILQAVRKKLNAK